MADSHRITGLAAGTSVLGEPVNERGGQMIVFEKRTPFAKAQVGSEEGGLFLMPLVHQGEEKPHLDRLDLDISNFLH